MDKKILAILRLLFLFTQQAFSYECVTGKLFSYFSTKTYALKPMNAFTYTPKPNAEMKTCTNWILFFRFQWLNMATMPGFHPTSHCIVLVTPAHTQPLYIFSNHGSHEGIVQRDNRDGYFPSTRLLTLEIRRPFNTK